MDGSDHTGVARFLANVTPHAGATVVLDEAAARHARVRRLEVGAPAQVTDGRGTIGTGAISRIGKTVVDVAVESVQAVLSLPRLELLVPVADRDRMLWLAEKAAELGVTVWQPVIFARSRSVSPRGEGASFARKVRARMAGALEQSGGAWLPEIRGECTLDNAVSRCTHLRQIVLAKGAEPLTAGAPFGEIALAVGPEGGLEPAESEFLASHGWRPASLGRSTLRFETAAIAAAAIVRVRQSG